MTWYRWNPFRAESRASLPFGGNHGTGATPPEDGGFALEGAPCPTATDFHALFADIAGAVATTLAVTRKAIVRTRDTSCLARLAALAALFARVEAALVGLLGLFIESAEAQAETGKTPRSTVNLQHFAICAIVIRPCPAPVLAGPEPPRWVRVRVQLTRAHIDCAVHCRVQEASVLVTQLCGRHRSRRHGGLLFHLAPVRPNPQEEGGRLVDGATLRVQTYFSALLIEHGFSPTGPRGPPVERSR